LPKDALRWVVDVEEIFVCQDLFSLVLGFIGFTMTLLVFYCTPAGAGFTYSLCRDSDYLSGLRAA
jgi:hypothetical protein